jgi:hypothetical protein
MAINLSRRLCSLSLLAIPLSGVLADMKSEIPVSANVSCRIQTMISKGTARLDAIVTGAGPVSGTYTFKVNKVAGHTVVSESGPFKIESASPSEIKKASIDLEPGEAYNASLTVTWPNGSSSCSSHVG